MRALSRLILAGATLALLSAPAFAAMGRVARIDTDRDVARAQQACAGWTLQCEPEALSEYCIAVDKCAMALPAGNLLRYDALMDAAAAR